MLYKKGYDQGGLGACGWPSPALVHEGDPKEDW